MYLPQPNSVTHEAVPSKLSLELTKLTVAMLLLRAHRLIRPYDEHFPSYSSIDGWMLLEAGVPGYFMLERRHDSGKREIMLVSAKQETAVRIVFEKGRADTSTTQQDRMYELAALLKGLSELHQFELATAKSCNVVEISSNTLSDQLTLCYSRKASLVFTGSTACDSICVNGKQFTPVNTCGLSGWQLFKKGPTVLLIPTTLPSKLDTVKCVEAVFDVKDCKNYLELELSALSRALPKLVRLD